MALLGRDLVLRAGEAAWAAARRGRGRLVLVAGEAGMGKTSVARALAEAAAGAGATVRWAAAWEGEEAIPLGLWIDCLRRPGGDACAAAAARLEAGAFGTADGDPGRGLGRFAAAVVDALAGDADAAGPQLLVLDDVHWADPISVRLLVAVAAQLPALPVLLVATYRDDELPTGGPLASIGGGAERFNLAGLGHDDVVALLTGVLGRPPSADEARAVQRDTAGNPLFVTEVGRLLAAGSSVTVPAGVRDVLARRLARLSSGCHRVLGAAAALGTTFDVPTLAGLVEATEVEVAGHLDEAAAARVVAPSADHPSGWAFVHPLLRDARYASLGTAERARLHRRAVDILAAPGLVPAGLLAVHVLRAAFEPDDPRPAEILVAAAREAVARLAADEAVGLAERAGRLAPLGPTGEELRAEARLVSGDAHLRRSDPGAAAAAAADFEAVATAGRKLDRPGLVAAAALGFAAGRGSFEVRLLDHRQVDLLEEAARDLPAGHRLRPLVQARLSVALSYVGSEERRLTLAEEAVAGARRAGDDRALAAAIAAHCDAIAGPDHVGARLTAATEVVTLAQRTGDVPLELLGRRLRVVALLERCDRAGFDAETRAFAAVAEQLGDPFYAWYVPIWQALRAEAAGDFDRALRLAGEAAESGRGAGSINAALLGRTVAVFAALERRDRDGFDATWDELVSIHPDFTSVFALPIRALAASAFGRLDEAKALLDRSGLDALTGLACDQEWLTAVGQLVGAAAVTGQRVILEHAYRMLAPYSGLGVFEGAGAVDHGTTDRFLALCAGALGDRDAARSYVDAALAAVADQGRLIAARVTADCVRALREGDDVDRRRAGDLAARAAADYDALGLTIRADEVRTLAALPPARIGMVAPRTGGEEAALRREGDTWVFTFEGTSARIRHAKGVADLAVLLARPGRDVHVRELEDVKAVPAGAAPDAVLDDTALSRYRRRLADLETDLDQAGRDADVGRAAKLAAERDALVAELTRQLGPGGRRRAAGPDPDERLRKAVSGRVKATLERLDRLHPRLARHLRSSVRTGFWCRYQPEHDIAWNVVIKPPETI